MATELKRSFQLPYPPQKVMDTMRKPEMIEASERKRGAKAVRVQDRHQDESKHGYTIHVSSPAMTIKGPDASKTEENRTEVDWDLSQHAGKWVYHKGGAQGAMVKVNGGYRIRPAGDGAELEMSATVSIGIPVMGKMIEKKVKAGFEDGWPAYVELLKSHLAK